MVCYMKLYFDDLLPKCNAHISSVEAVEEVVCHVSWKYILQEHLVERAHSFNFLSLHPKLVSPKEVLLG